MTDRQSRLRIGAIGLCGSAAALLTGALAAPALAQDPPGAVVQQVPPPAVDALGNAMRQLSSDPNNLEALIAAGNAALVLHDSGAAVGFFARAAKIAPRDPRVALGYGRVEFARRHPVDALRLFADAEKGGAAMGSAELERAIAYDLVGENGLAQEIYLKLLRERDDAEVRQKLAISQAIAGKRAEFERTLLPLLQRKDRSAYRTRAFGLAILGRSDEAVAIADAMMPSDMALRMAPYLRYMPRLTRAQQAAAADLGTFPSESQIGRDTPEIAAYAGQGRRAERQADAALIPSGPTLGQRPAQTPRSDRSTARLAVAEPQATRQPTRTASGELPPATGTRSEQPLNSSTQRLAVPERAAPRPAVANTGSRAGTSSGASTTAPATTTIAPPTRSAVVEGRSPLLTAPAPRTIPAPPTETVAQAFADLGPAPRTAVVKRSNVVDMARYKPPLEQSAADKAAEKKAAADKAAAKKAAAEKAAKDKAEREKKAKEKANPARYWVQVATGRSTKALGFDWKRIADKSNGILDNKGPYTTPWVAANRLLAGPYPSEKAADRVIKKLKDKGIDCFAFTSDPGQVVDKID